MRKFLLVFIMLHLCSLSQSQILRGKILDQMTDSTISFASVYFNGTLSGTLSDKNGCFEMDISKYLSMPITISALGYYSVSLSGFSYDRPLSIYLTPKVFELKEVIVNAKGYAQERRNNIRLFKQQFLGKTFNALKCEIVNMNDITFTWDTYDETLKAFASKPILINNNALGYKITYYLDKFEYCVVTQSLRMIGNYIFREDTSAGKKQSETFERRRRSAYLGSRMHFFRSLWDKELNLNGFSIQNDYGTPALFLEMQKDSSTKYLKYRGDLIINYYQKLRGSVISMMQDSVCFDRQGYFDPLGISWTGEMARQRIADLLPYDYEVKKNHP